MLNARAHWLIFALFGFTLVRAEPAAAREQLEVPYRAPSAPAEAYAVERCRLDVHLPAATAPAPFPLLVWFHGGGLTGGNKNAKDELIAIRHLVANGVAVVAANYRLSPRATFPTYVEDAAVAVHWATAHAAELGADPARVYVGGFSAGAYLTALLALDPSYLGAAEAGPIAGFIALSGQMSTHFTVRAESGLPKDAVIVNGAAPLAHVRPACPRLLLIVGEHDWPARLEENQLLAAALEKLAKNPPIPLVVVPERTHATMLPRFGETKDPAAAAVLAFLAPAPLAPPSTP
jgi:acetyl esterase/lipase